MGNNLLYYRIISTCLICAQRNTLLPSEIVTISIPTGDDNFLTCSRSRPSSPRNGAIQWMAGYIEEIERDTYSDELLEKLRSLIPGGDYSFVNELKDRNRGMILLLLDKIKESGEKGFIPLLKAWREIDYRKVREEISKVINHLDKGDDMPHKVIDLREYRQRKQKKE